MTLSIITQSLQFSAWLIALVELVLGLYLIAINAMHSANRHASTLLLVIAANSFAIGWMLSVTSPTQAWQPAILLAITTPAIQPLLLLASIALVKPEWLRGRSRWAWWLLDLIALIPALLTFADLGLGTNYWFSGLPSPLNNGGIIYLDDITTGQYASVLRIAAFTLIPALTVLVLLYFTLVDKNLFPNNRRLAWLLMIATLATFGLFNFIAPLLLPAATTLLSSTVIAAAFSYAAVQQMISERRAQRGSLQARLVALILIVSLPILLAISVFVIQRAGSLLGQYELTADVIVFQRNALIVLGVGVVLLLFLSWFTIRQAIQPISDLKEIAASITAGDLTCAATIQTDDEIGSLARAFNSMTTQLRESITNLERRIAERTRDLERRAFQFQVAADVANQAAAIHDLAQLLDQTVRLISERFNFYHAGIFLIDENEKYAILRAASSEGGRHLLARNYKLAIGQKGIVGYVAGKGEPRIALDVGSDTVYLNNPDLPQTRSEMALPLKVRGRVMGVLDVQSTKAASFSEEDVEVLQVLADQVALAIDNARTHAESEATIRELNALTHQQTNQWWQRRLESGDLIYSYHSGRVTEGEMPRLEDGHQDPEGRFLNLPLLLRGQSLGQITLHRHQGSPPWSKEEIEMASQIVTQIVLSLENARLLEENRRRALMEALVGQISDKTQGLLDVDTVIKTAAQEIGRSLGLARIQIRLENDESEVSTSNEVVEGLSPQLRV